MNKTSGIILWMKIFRSFPFQAAPKVLGRNSPRVMVAAFDRPATGIRFGLANSPALQISKNDRKSRYN